MITSGGDMNMMVFGGGDMFETGGINRLTVANCYTYSLSLFEKVL